MLMLTLLLFLWLELAAPSTTLCPPLLIAATGAVGGCTAAVEAAGAAAADEASFPLVPLLLAAAAEAETVDSGTGCSVGVRMVLLLAAAAPEDITADAALEETLSGDRSHRLIAPH